MLVERLITLVAKNPQQVPVHAQGSRALTKSNIKKWFKAEYDQAICELEAEQKYLHLCSVHWMADVMLGQAFMQKSDVEHKRVHASENTSMPPPEEPNHVPARIPVSDVAPINMAKRALELSPVPKSPLASCTQKHSKDETTHFGWKNKGHSVPPDHEFSPDVETLTKLVCRVSMPCGMQVCSNVPQSHCSNCRRACAIGPPCHLPHFSRSSRSACAIKSPSCLPLLFCPTWCAHLVPPAYSLLTVSCHRRVVFSLVSELESLSLDMIRWLVT
jgi:hypothetical protein